MQCNTTCYVDQPRASFENERREGLHQDNQSDQRSVDHHVRSPHSAPGTEQCLFESVRLYESDLRPIECNCASFEASMNPVTFLCPATTQQSSSTAN
jgi:hypothetical protein